MTLMALWFTDFTCPSTEPGVFQHPCDCTLGILCENGEPTETGCEDGLYFNPENRECDLPENSNCVLTGGGQEFEPKPASSSDQSKSLE